MQFNLFMYCTVGRQAELGLGMTGKDPRHYRRMLDEIAASIATMDNMPGRRIGPDKRAAALPAT